MNRLKGALYLATLATMASFYPSKIFSDELDKCGRFAIGGGPRIAQILAPSELKKELNRSTTYMGSLEYIPSGYLSPNFGLSKDSHGLNGSSEKFNSLSARLGLNIFFKRAEDGDFLPYARLAIGLNRTSFDEESETNSLVEIGVGSEVFFAGGNACFDFRACLERIFGPEATDVAGIEASLKVLVPSFSMTKH